jgi:Spy/CpxP family protein refolding chaperone
MKHLSRFALVAAVAALALSLASTAAVAQPPGGGGRGGFRGGPGGGGFFGGGGGTLQLVQSEEVQQEIELTDDQGAKLREIGDTVRDQVRSEMSGMFEGMRDLSDEERQARFGEIREKMEAITKDAEAQMQTVLLPHQFDRLKQIDVQSRLQRGGAGALTGGELAETLGLTDAQREQIEEKAEEVQKDLEAKISQLRVDARNQLLEVLTPEQKAKLQSMMGSDFAVPEQQFGPPGGRGGRNAGFGGGRGGRGGRGERGDRGGRGGRGGDGGSASSTDTQ